VQTVKFLQHGSNGTIGKAGVACVDSDIYPRAENVALTLENPFSRTPGKQAYTATNQ